MEFILLKKIFNEISPTFFVSDSLSFTHTHTHIHFQQTVLYFESKDRSYHVYQGLKKSNFANSGLNKEASQF